MPGSPGAPPGPSPRRGAIRSRPFLLRHLRPSPCPSAEPPKPVAPPPPSPVGRSGLLLLIGLLVLGFAVVVGVLFLLLKRTKPPEERVCEQCGRTLNLWENDCPHCLAQKLAITKPGTESTTPAAVAIPEIDPALLQKGPSSESLEHTMVLDEVPVLVLHRGNNPPRMFQLPHDQVVSVGRDKVNTLSVADQTLSAQHFRIVPKEGRFYLVDLQVHQWYPARWCADLSRRAEGRLRHPRGAVRLYLPPGPEEAQLAEPAGPASAKRPAM